MPEFILLSFFLLAVVFIKIVYKEYRIALAGRIAMAAMMTTTSVAHFIYANGMVLMLPDIIPYRLELVYFTGFLELIAAIGILVPKYRKLTAWLLILFLILIIPSNIYATIKHVNLETATFDGDGPYYLLYRIPLQLFFIAWVYLSCIGPFKAKNMNIQ